MLPPSLTTSPWAASQRAWPRRGPLLNGKVCDGLAGGCPGQQSPTPGPPGPRKVRTPATPGQPWAMSPTSTAMLRSFWGCEGVETSASLRSSPVARDGTLQVDYRLQGTLRGAELLHAAPLRAFGSAESSSRPGSRGPPPPPLTPLPPASGGGQVLVRRLALGRVGGVSTKEAGALCPAGNGPDQPPGLAASSQIPQEKRGRPCARAPLQTSRFVPALPAASFTSSAPPASELLRRPRPFPLWVEPAESPAPSLTPSFGRDWPSERRAPAYGER